MDTIRILLYSIAVFVTNQHKIKGEKDFEIDIRKYQGNGIRNIPSYQTHIDIIFINYQNLILIS